MRGFVFLQVIIIGDANGAILAYDALCLNHIFDDATSLYGEGIIPDRIRRDSSALRVLAHTCHSLLFIVEGSTPRTPALSKRTTGAGQHDNSDTTSLQSSHRQSTRRTTTTTDATEYGDSV